jgi:hypothetical protein
MKHIRIKYVVCILVIYLFISLVLFSKFQTKSSDYSNLNSKHFETSGSTLALGDILIAVKTSSIYHETRLQYIYETWFNYHPSQVDFQQFQLLEFNFIDYFCVVF